MLSLCRLCAKDTHDTDLTTQVFDLQPKLSLCCGWKPSENESQMPQKACSLCVDRLERSWEFAETVWAAEQSLYKLTCELDQTNLDIFVPVDIEILPNTIKSVPDAIKSEQDFGAVDTEGYDFPIDEIVFDQPNDDGPSDDEFDEKVLVPNKSAKKSNEKIYKEYSDTDAILNALDDEDRIKDGTINAKGVAKLQKLFPEMSTISWSDCKFKCDKCIRTFNGPHNFFAHNRSFHMNEILSMELSCFYCNSKHRREYTLNRHIAMEHFSHLKFRCWYCTDYFWDARELIKHRNLHTDVEYKCEICGQISFSRDILYAHITMSHLKKAQSKKLTNPGEKFTCEICSKDFATKWSIKSHMLQHTKKFDYVCDQCGWKFLTKGNLKGHLETTHTNEKPFPCNQCDMKFKTKHQLSSHSKRHEDFKPLECTICSKRFRQMYNLTVHMRSHNDINPYTCKYCDRKFRHTSSLKTHERTHTSEKPYVCGHCDYRCTNWPNLNKHSMRIHSIDLRIKKPIDDSALKSQC